MVNIELCDFYEGRIQLVERFPRSEGSGAVAVDVAAGWAELAGCAASGAEVWLLGGVALSRFSSALHAAIVTRPNIAIATLTTPRGQAISRSLSSLVPRS